MHLLPVQAAEESGKPVDFFYCKELLESTGIVTVPGSGFKQVMLCHHPNILQWSWSLLPIDNLVPGPATYAL